MKYQIILNCIAHLKTQYSYITKCIRHFPTNVSSNLRMCQAILECVNVLHLIYYLILSHWMFERYIQTNDCSSSNIFDIVYCSIPVIKPLLYVSNFQNVQTARVNTYDKLCQNSRVVKRNIRTIRTIMRAQKSQRNLKQTIYMQRNILSLYPLIMFKWFARDTFSRK